VVERKEGLLPFGWIVGLKPRREDLKGPKRGVHLEEEDFGKRIRILFGPLPISFWFQRRV